ncbi:MAG: ABC transporter permease subunit [Acidimicrobiia bacterium]|nr:ABC transporter permease subunit [Acidimicrobiia bacterium]
MTTAIQRPTRPPFYRDVTVLKWVFQIAFLIGIVTSFWILGSFSIANLAKQNLAVSWDFMSRPVGFQVAEGFTTHPNSGFQALLVGITNMLRVTISGIVAATILGTIIGVSRLSHNWLVSKLATVYIEVIRNIPLLVQIVFWGIVVSIIPNLVVDEGNDGSLQSLFGLRILPEGWIFASPKGFAMPWFVPTDGRWQWVGFMIVGAVAARYVYGWRIRLQEAGTAEARGFLWAGGVLLAFGVVGIFAHPLMGIFGPVFGFLAAFFMNTPIIIFQIALAGLVAFGGYSIIKKRLDELRTPAGLGKLTDDDWFRLSMAAVVAAGLALFFLLRAGPVVALVGQGSVFGQEVGLSQLFTGLQNRFSIGTGAPFDFSLPALDGRFNNFSADAGHIITRAYFALWIGVVLYTAAFIGEAVRAGVLAVPRGQSEAGFAVGLKRSQLLRMIVLPQAFRIILPPVGNQYLNLAKNTSLGIAVAYPDIVQVGQTIFNQTGQTIPIVISWMAWYSFVSLTLSAIVNRWNKKLKLVER